MDNTTLFFVILGVCNAAGFFMKILAFLEGEKK